MASIACIACQSTLRQCHLPTGLSELMRTWWPAKKKQKNQRSPASSLGLYKPSKAHSSLVIHSSVQHASWKYQRATLPVRFGDGLLDGALSRWVFLAALCGRAFLLALLAQFRWNKLRLVLGYTAARFKRQSSQTTGSNRSTLLIGLIM